jgi:predicted  nucleic acid-binding Zn-ribbon protein
MGTPHRCHRCDSDFATIDDLVDHDCPDRGDDE